MLPKNANLNKQDKLEDNYMKHKLNAEKKDFEKALDANPTVKEFVQSRKKYYYNLINEKFKVGKSIGSEIFAKAKNDCLKEGTPLKQDLEELDAFAQKICVAGGGEEFLKFYETKKASYLKEFLIERVIHGRASVNTARDISEKIQKDWIAETHICPMCLFKKKGTPCPKCQCLCTEVEDSAFGGRGGKGWISYKCYHCPNKWSEYFD